MSIYRWRWIILFKTCHCWIYQIKWKFSWDKNLVWPVPVLLCVTKDGSEAPLKGSVSISKPAVGAILDGEQIIRYRKRWEGRKGEGRGGEDMSLSHTRCWCFHLNKKCWKTFCACACVFHCYYLLCTIMSSVLGFSFFFLDRVPKWVISWVGQI